MQKIDKETVVPVLQIQTFVNSLRHKFWLMNIYKLLHWNSM